MNKVKMFFRYKRGKVWSIVSLLIILILTVVTVLSLTMFNTLFNIVMPGGGPRSVYAEGINPMYLANTTSKKDALDKANEFNIEMAENGMVLLKNKNNALPLYTSKTLPSITSKTKVSVFGKNSVNLAYGGSGSGGGDNSAAVTINKSLTEAGYEVNPTLENFYNDNKQSGEPRKANSSDLDSGGNQVIATAETPIDKYTDRVKSSFDEYKEAAIIVFTRIGGEGFDLPRYQGNTEGARKADDHYLQLDKNETDLLKMVSESNFDKIIVVINSGSAMELSFLEKEDYYAYNSKIDAAIWMGFPGNTGVMALGKILNGEVNPSGRTVDTYASNFKDDPTFMNFGYNQEIGDNYKDQTGKGLLYYFVDYEEGIYSGYRYYETRGFTDGQEWYDKNVVYPFGYGLSYTTFDWTMANKTALNNSKFNKDSKIEIEVEVKNTGTVPGKEVVQLYASAPYKSNGIEKPHVILVGFAKTSIIKPGEKEIVRITFDPYNVASYDYNDANENGFKGYELEKGQYELKISKNANKQVDSIKLILDQDQKYEKDPITGTVVKNLYTEQENKFFNSDTELSTLLSRSDWDGTWPTQRTSDELVASNDLIKAFEDRSHNNPNDYSNDDMPWQGAEVSKTMRDLLPKETPKEINGRLVEYDNENWDLILDAISTKDMINMFSYAAFKSDRITNIGKPKTNDTDGPAGFVNFMDKTTFYGTAYYSSQSLIASSWSEEILYEFGETVGEEGIWGNAKGDGAPYSGWYAPGVNIHRNAFGGRNFEYYSEDAYLSGVLAAAQIKGAQSKGVYTFVKHLALNDQETHRSINGVMTWVTEQAMREVYLRPFELTVKLADARGMMSAFNRIGTRWTGGDYRLLTTILRDEWGFKGAVISDFNTVAYMDSRQMAYAGGDLNLATLPKNWVDESDVSDMIVLRNATKNVLYTVINSNAMNGEVVGQKPAYWVVALWAINGVAFVALGTWGFFTYKKINKLEKNSQKNN